ncbi:MAG: hypothetical protein A2539_07420 [Elusimicrobia bacterium RIFOXYD2_FULL_34_15]|nr:MAG: hypothetical protein A2539_07420 [Elusimicrobia bacterium RIFOXYD2_FULL_34_15]
MAKGKFFSFGRRFGESSRMDPNLWVVSYGNTMTLLMIFFLILYSNSYNLKQKSIEAQKTEDQLLVKKLEKFGSSAITGDKIKVTFSQDIIFQSASPTLSKDFDNILIEVSDYLKKSSGTVIISGHADATPLKGGKYKDNWFLSAERGWNVAQELIKNGIDPNRLQIRGYGEFNPVADNSTEEGRGKNRRIEMTIMKVQTEEPKRYIYYKASGLENINELAKKYLGDEKFSEVIKGLNPGKIDADGKILKDAEILIPYNP